MNILLSRATVGNEKSAKREDRVNFQSAGFLAQPIPRGAAGFLAQATPPGALVHVKKVHVKKVTVVTVLIVFLRPTPSHAVEIYGET